MPATITVRAWPPASTTPLSRRTGSSSGPRLTDASPACSARSSTSAISAFCTAGSPSAPRRVSPMCARSVATLVAMSRRTVRIVPSTGWRTDAYARCAARAIAAPISTGSTSSPGRLMSSSAAPRMSCDRITPELPRAPSSAARATESTISSRPMSSIRRSPSAARRSSSASTARSVSAMLSPVSPSATGKTLRSLISPRRDSRCCSAPSTTVRKRTRLGSDTRVDRRSPAAATEGRTLPRRPS